MRVREECKPDSEDVQIQGPRRDPHQELMLLEKLTGNYSLMDVISLQVSKFQIALQELVTTHLLTVEVSRALQSQKMSQQ